MIRSRLQREPDIGDRQTGKTAIAIRHDPQPEGAKDVAAVYCAIGQENHLGEPTCGDGLSLPREREAPRFYTVVVGRRGLGTCRCFNIWPPTPGAAMRRETSLLRAHGHPVVYDDLTKRPRPPPDVAACLRRPRHGVRPYPAMSLLPQVRLLERAAKLSDAMGKGRHDRPADASNPRAGTWSGPSHPPQP